MLKKTIYTGIIVFLMLLTSNGKVEAATFDNFTYGSIGYKEPMFNFSVAHRFVNYGFEIGCGLRLYPEIHDYPCPHDDYIILDDHYYSVHLGIDMLRYVDLGESITIYGGVGVYLLEYQTVVRSNATDWVYRQNSTVDLSFAYSGGFQIHTNDRYGFGIGYHSVRGVNLQFIVDL